MKIDIYLLLIIAALLTSVGTAVHWCDAWIPLVLLCIAMLAGQGSRGAP